MALSESRMKVLVDNIRNNDSSSFSELYTVCFPGVYRFCYKFLKSKELAQECTQLTFIKIWELRNQLNSELNFKSYLFTISKNAVLKTIEKAAREQSLKQSVLASYESDSDFDMNDSLSMETLARKAFEQLPPQRQVVFQLVKVDGHSYAETALTLGISTGTVRDHLFKASKSIRKFLSVHRILMIAASLTTTLL